MTSREHELTVNALVELVKLEREREQPEDGDAQAHARRGAELEKWLHRERPAVWLLLNGEDRAGSSPVKGGMA